MPESPLAPFTDFFNDTTGPAYFTGPGNIVNDAQLRNYEAFDALSRMKMELQGGNQIKDDILLDLSGRAVSYSPGQTANVVNTQHQTTITQDWKFVRSYATWTEAELMLNENGGSPNLVQYKKLRDAKYQEMWTDLITKMEEYMVQPVANAEPNDPASIFTYITSDGLAPSGETNVMGVNPSTKENWRNQTASYDNSKQTDGTDGIIGGFDTMSQLVRFKAPSRQQKQFTESDFDKLVVMTNREGRKSYMQALRANNNFTRAGAQDPAYGSPLFLGVPVVACEGFDKFGVFEEGSPGFIFINGNFLKLFCHTKKWFQVGKAMTNADKPDTAVVWNDSYLNTFCRSRARNGYLSGVTV